MRKAMIIVSVIIKLLLVVRALFTRRGFPGPLRGGNCPGAGLNGSGNNLCGVSPLVRLAAWLAPPRTCISSKALRSYHLGLQPYPMRRHGRGRAPLITHQQRRTFGLFPVYP